MKAEPAYMLGRLNSILTIPSAYRLRIACRELARDYPDYLEALKPACEMEVEGDHERLLPAGREKVQAAMDFILDVVFDG